VFISVLCVFNKFVDHGGRQDNTAQTLAQWWHPVASSAALDVLNWAMHPALYRRICMAIEIASDLPAFFIIVIFLSPITIAKHHVMVQII
jgi:hypothetical protein